MQVAIEIPEDISVRLSVRAENLSRRALEALAVEAYRAGDLTSYEVQRLLGLDSRWATEEFLKRKGGWLLYTEADLESDLKTLRELPR